MAQPSLNIKIEADEFIADLNRAIDLLRQARRARWRAIFRGLCWLAGAALLVWLLMSLMGCSLYTGDQITTASSSSQQTQGASPSASPSPGSGTSEALCAMVATIRVAPFDSTCATPEPLAVGCVLQMTATPKTATGADPTAAPGMPVPEIAWSYAGQGVTVSVRPWPDNPYNLRVEGLTPGPYSLEASVCGRKGAYTGTVR
jgi:hypothetical protein